jgi:nicotinate-nucleotide pyrophosphorylase (carboxylating)
VQSLLCLPAAQLFRALADARRWDYGFRIVIPDFLLNDVIDRALAEDLSGGDVTSAAAVAEEERAVARAVAKTPLVVCGGELFARAFYRVDPGLRVEERLAEGTRAQPGDVLWLVEGSARSILMAERTALNFTQRLAGVATLTRRFVDAVPAGSKLRIADTRKTTPGLRFLERYAVRTGGGHNHRDCLGSAVLIKDNHIIAAGGIRPAIERARAHAPHTSRIEIEVESLEQLDEALAAGAEIVMLDNFAPAALKVAVEKARGRALVEVSGGVTLGRVEELAAVGVDVVSVGALTHSAPAADIALDIERIG